MSKKSKIIIISVFAIAGFLVFIFSRGVFKAAPVSPNDSVGQVEKNNFVLPEEIVLAEESIPLTWTDDNTGENLIIKSDRQYYDGRDSSEVYFSITNISDKDQKPDIKFLFDEKEGRGMKEIALLNSQNDVIAVGQTNFYKAVIYYPQNSKGEFFIEAKGDKGGYGFLDPYYASGLVGYWSFNGADIAWNTGTAYDRSGTSPANNGTITNMSTTTSPVAGISGQALSFDGDYVEVTDVAQTGLDITGSISISCWVKFNALSGATEAQAPCVSKYYNAAGSRQYKLAYLYFSGQSTFWFIISDGSLNPNVNTFGLLNPTTNVWYHVVAVWNQSENKMKIYVNGNLIQSANTTIASIADTAANFRIGANSDGTYYLNGLIDEVRIYNRALSADEIQDLYRVDSARAKFTAGTARIKVNTPITLAGPQSGLVGNWSFNGPDINWATGVAFDRSGQSNNGAITNMSTTTSPAPGISGQALSFDGVNDYVNNGSASNLDNLTSLTYSAWIYVKGGGGFNSGSIYNKGNTSIFKAILLSWGTNSLRGWIDHATTDASSISTTNTLSPNVWYHVAMTWSTADNQVDLFINGTETTYNSQTSGVGSANVDATLDAYVGVMKPGFMMFNGLIDEVRVYNRALSADEIGQLYRAGARRVKF